MVSLLDKLDYWADKDPDKLLFAFLDIDGNQTDKYTYNRTGLYIFMVLNLLFRF